MELKSLDGTYDESCVFFILHVVDVFKALKFGSDLTSKVTN